MVWLAVYEGGKVDDPDDPGGRTNRGVTQRVYDAYRRARNLSVRDVWDMEAAAHDAIYLEQYWTPSWGDRLPAGVDAAVFDFAVHSGVRRPMRTVQRIVGVSRDGIIGNVTLAAIMDYCASKSTERLIITLCERRLVFLKGLRVWWKYKNGWTTRVEGDEPGAQDGDIGVVDRSVMLAAGLSKDIQPPKNQAPGKAPENDRCNCHCK